MTLRETTREVRDIITGNSGHTYIKVWREGRSWKTETYINYPGSAYTTSFDERSGVVFYHDCNDMTIKAALELIKEKFFLS